MPSFCAAVGCSNSSAKWECQDKNVSFHKFPLRNKKLLKAWLIMMRRDEFNPTQYSQLCSEHFEEAFFTYQPFSNRRFLVANAVPTKFKHNESDAKGKRPSFLIHNPVSDDVVPLKMRLIDLRTNTNTNTVPLVLRMYPVIRKESKCDDVTTEFSSHNIGSNHTSSSSLSSGVSISDDSKIHHHNKNDDTEAVSSFSNLEFEKMFLRRRESECAFRVERITDDTVMYSATGFSIKAFHAIFKLLCLKDLLKKTRVSPLDQFFLIMVVYLKTGMPQRCLCFLYKIKLSSLSRTIVNTADIVYKKLKEFDIWPSQQAVLKNTPLSFSQKFPNCRIIVDCMEFNIQMPSSPLAQAETLNRKCTYTRKGMIGITPFGTVSFISDLVGGSICDKELFLSSGLLDLLQPGDLVLADEGFGVKSELAERGCELATSHFCNSDVTHNEEALLHIENVINRIKGYKYFNNQIINLGLQHLNKYFFIVAFFFNFANPLVLEDD